MNMACMRIRDCGVLYMPEAVALHRAHASLLELLRHPQTFPPCAFHPPQLLPASTLQ
jgi:hypothetical protein